MNPMDSIIKILLVQKHSIGVEHKPMQKLLHERLSNKKQNYKKESYSEVGKAIMISRSKCRYKKLYMIRGMMLGIT